MAQVVHSTREAWLEAAVALLAPSIRAEIEDFYLAPRVSVGFSSTRARTSIGVCYPRYASQDGRAQIFISPILVQEASPQGVLATLLHEMCHAALPDEVKSHGKEFGKLAGAVGLLRPWAATSAGEELSRELEAFAKVLGPFPHSELTLGEKRAGEQKNRWLKCECEACGYVCRAAKKWIIISPPLCACNGLPMLPEVTEEQDDAD